MKNSLQLGLAALTLSATALFSGCQSGGSACVGFQGHSNRACPVYSGCSQPSPCQSPCYQADPCANGTGYYGGQQLYTPNPATTHGPGTPTPATRPAPMETLPTPAPPTGAIRPTGRTA